MQLKHKLNLVIILFLLLILTVPAYASVNIENQYIIDEKSICPFIYYNNDTHHNSYDSSYHNSNYFVNSSYVCDHLSDEKTYLETNITSLLCYNIQGKHGKSITSDNQTITDYITNLTATNYSTTVYIYVYKFVNYTNFKDLYIYENNNTEYDFNSYNNINENYNISSIVSAGKNITFSLSFNPKNQTSPTTESGNIYYMLYFNDDNTVYYKYRGVINIDITTEKS